MYIIWHAMRSTTVTPAEQAGHEAASMQEGARALNDSIARRNLALADAYTKALPPGPVLDFCSLPLALAYATLDSLARGSGKLNRDAVRQIVERQPPTTTE